MSRHREGVIDEGGPAPCEIVLGRRHEHDGLDRLTTESDAETVESTDALFEPVGGPGHVDVSDDVGELEVASFFGAGVTDENSAERFGAEPVEFGLPFLGSIRFRC